MLYTRPSAVARTRIAGPAPSSIAGVANAEKNVFTEPSKRLRDIKKIASLEKLVMADRETGTARWFNESKGYGFMQRESGHDVFVQYGAIRGEGHRTLVEGQKVEFGVTQGQKGLQAEDVSAL